MRKTAALKKLEQELERAATALSKEPTAEVSRSQQADGRESSRSAVVSAIAECRDEGQLDAAIQQLDSAASPLLCQDERVIGWESFLAEVKHAALLLADNEANPGRPRFLSSRGLLLLIFVGVAALAVGGWFLTSDRQMFAKGMCYSGDKWTQGDVVEIPCANVGVADFEVIGTGDISRLAVGTSGLPLDWLTFSTRDQSLGKDEHHGKTIPTRIP